MTLSIKAGLASAGLALAATFAIPAAAADLGDAGGRGSIKDYTHVTIARAPAGPCYFRADTGYSFSGDPSLSWHAQATNTVASTNVQNTSMDNSWLVEAGAGCGSGSRGVRGELMFGYHGDRNINGMPGMFGVGNPAVPTISPIRSSLQTYTSMVNVYYDLGQLGGFVPYVGAGVGLAYNRMADYSLPWASTTPYAVHGANDLSLAWSLMVGGGYQISDRAIIDLGYRYIDFGSAATARNDNWGGAQVSRLAASDLTAHEIKVGLRYHFGPGGDCCAAAMPLK
jgi:opacity protein-like surface antigen